MTQQQVRAMSDNQIVELYMDSQNPMLFSELYNRYSSKIYSRCLSLLKDSALAEDAAQDVFLKIFLKLSTFNRSAMFSTWVYSITYNYCIDTIRKSKRSPIVEKEENLGAHLADDEVNESDILEMELGKLKEALEKIPADDKALILMKYQDEMSIKDICESLSKSESAVKMKLLRARQKVKDSYLAPVLILVAALILAMVILL